MGADDEHVVAKGLDLLQDRFGGLFALYNQSFSGDAATGERRDDGVRALESLVVEIAVDDGIVARAIPWCLRRNRRGIDPSCGLG